MVHAGLTVARGKEVATGPAKAMMATSSSFGKRPNNSMQ